MLLIGVAFLLFGGLINFFSLSVPVAAFVTGFVFLFLGIVVGDRLTTRK